MKTHPHETTVVGVFKSPTEAQSALRALDSFHLQSKDVSLVTSQDAYEKEEIVKLIMGDTLHESAIHAGKIGGVTGFILAGLTAITAMITGGASLLAAGPAVAIISGAGGLLGALLGGGFTENEAMSIDNAIRAGDVLIVVHAENKDIAKHAEGVLKEQGAKKVQHHH